MMWVNRTEHPDNKPKIAKFDITAYKALKIQDGQIKSPYYNQYWIDGETITFNNLTVDETLIDFPSVSKGLHACRTVEGAQAHANLIRDSIVVTVIIPASSEYFIDQWHDIVANKMIMQYTNLAI